MLEIITTLPESFSFILGKKCSISLITPPNIKKVASSISLGVFLPTLPLMPIPALAINKSGVEISCIKLLSSSGELRLQV